MDRFNRCIDKMSPKKPTTVQRTEYKLITNQERRDNPCEQHFFSQSFQPDPLRFTFCLLSNLLHSSVQPERSLRADITREKKLAWRTNEQVSRGCECERLLGVIQPLIEVINNVPHQVSRRFRVGPDNLPAVHKFSFYHTCALGPRPLKKAGNEGNEAVSNGSVLIITTISLNLT